jgi:hypothetical protein
MTESVVLSDALKSFLGEVFPAVAATKRQDGSVHLNPVWFEYDDGFLWLNSFRGSKWLARVEREGSMSLLFIDPKDMYRVAEVVATLAESTEDGAVDHIHRLSHRYLGKDYPWLGDRTRVKVQLAFTRVHSSMQS